MTSKSSKVLIVTDFYFPATKAGGIVRSLKYLVTNYSDYFNFLIISSDRDFGDIQTMPGITPDLWVKQDSGAKVMYLKETSIFRISQLIKEVSPDVVYINGLFSPSFNLNPILLARFFKNIKFVVAPRGMLQAFRELNLNEAELIIVGPVLEAGDILEQYKGQYTYYPFMHHEELAEQYREADIFVFPSYLDSWAMTVVEAMACGTPVIVSEHTGAKDAVQQEGGFIIPVDDVAAIKEKIRFFYEDRAALQSYGKQAHAVAQQYTWENYEKQIHTIMEQIITAREEQKA